jgi:hypothetical protein
MRFEEAEVLIPKGAARLFARSPEGYGFSQLSPQPMCNPDPVARHT